MTLDLPNVLALDFDGVLCDGLLEYFQTSWRAYCQVWPTANPIPPDDLATLFYRLRPVVETGWEMPVLLRAVLKGFSEAEILATWKPICSQIVVEEDLRPQDLAAKVDGIRDQWITEDLTGWLALHHFYPGVSARLQQLIDGPVKIFIVTTKEGRFVRQLLQQEDIQLPGDRIFGKERRRPKPETLRTLQQESKAPIWFVEDRLLALQAVKRQTDLNQIRLFLADWGYNTPADQAVARQDDQIRLLSLSHFTQDFAVWPQPKSL
jgi:phosphoglycolate phosphatase-like HAD superfamily hydrolase